MATKAEKTVVEGLESGANPPTVETYGNISNGTKDTVTLTNVTPHDWFGAIGNPPYPKDINIQTSGKFTHDGTADESAAAVVYDGKNIVGDECYILLAWSNTSHSLNKAYTDIQEAGYAWDWNVVYDNLKKSSAKPPPVTYNGIISEVELVDKKFTAKLSLKA